LSWSCVSQGILQGIEQKRQVRSGVGELGFEPRQADPESERAALQADEAQALPAEQGLRLHTGCTDQAGIPADLARLIDAWPKLPEHVRRAILTLAGG
jgi:hypothetical protein